MPKPKMPAVPLFSLSRPWRLARDVVGHPVHASHLVDEAVGDAAEENVVEGVEVGSHVARRANSVQRA